MIIEKRECATYKCNACGDIMLVSNLFHYQSLFPETMECSCKVGKWPFRKHGIMVKESEKCKLN